MENNQVLKTTTNRSVYNKMLLRVQDNWSSKERNRRRRECYYKHAAHKYTYYGYDLITNQHIPRQKCIQLMSTYTYGTGWEWRSEYKYTVLHDKRPNWKLTSKARKQYSTKKLKLVKWNQRGGYDYKW